MNIEVKKRTLATKRCKIDPNCIENEIQVTNSKEEEREEMEIIEEIKSGSQKKKVIFVGGSGKDNPPFLNSDFEEPAKSQENKFN